jgi:hypothetical protein
MAKDAQDEQNSSGSATKGGGGDLAELRLSVERLTQGLQLMLETQETQTEMLRALLAAAAAPMPAESPVADALTKLAAIVNAQTSQLVAVQTSLAQLPRAVGAEVANGVQAALSAAL